MLQTISPSKEIRADFCIIENFAVYHQYFKDTSPETTTTLTLRNSCATVTEKKKANTLEEVRRIQQKHSFYCEAHILRPWLEDRMELKGAKSSCG
ncbi:hypothetical protein N7513_003465 [Penicillium frequentans]|nr:hypothetical protein N7513_003465 [Penicillium glabrum]